LGNTRTWLHVDAKHVRVALLAARVHNENVELARVLALALRQPTLNIGLDLPGGLGEGHAGAAVAVHQAASAFLLLEGTTLVLGNEGDHR
jgi:hypothetical protein